MLAIRMQRTGRHGHAQFRLIVQDSRFSPKSGRVVAYLGSYNPHTKVAAIDNEKASSYLTKGAQPSDRAARLLQKEGVKLPTWVKLSAPKKRDIRHAEKLRRNRPPEAPKPAAEPEVTPEPAAEDVAPIEAEAPAEASAKEESASEPTAKAEDPKETPPGTAEEEVTAELPAEKAGETSETPVPEESSEEPKKASEPEESPSDSTS